VGIVGTEGVSGALDVSLESVSQALRGYDRGAVEQLFGRVKADHDKLLAERDDLKAQLEVALPETRACLLEAQQLGDELAGIQVELDRLQERERALDQELRSVRRELAGYERREQVVTEMLDAARQAAQRMRANASSEAGKTLKKARARGARLVSEATRLLESAKRNAAKAEGDARAAAERMLREAGKRQAEIDTAAEERLESAKKAAGKIRADARAEADTLVNNAKEREAEIVANSQREVERLGAERQRSSKIAGELREELSRVLVSTLAQLTASLEEEAGQESPVETAADVGEAKAQPTGEDHSRTLLEPHGVTSALTELIKVRVHSKSADDEGKDVVSPRFDTSARKGRAEKT
jgi:cell division septum initiation protein DivIVA